RTGGLGAIYALPGNVLARAAAARSRHDNVGAGSFALLGVERQWLRSSLTAQFQTASRGYRELGTSDVQLPIRRQFAANFAHYEGLHSFGFGIARIDRFDADSLTTLSLNYGLHLPNRATLNAY